MAKKNNKIEFTFDGKNYTLEYNREAVEALEDEGVSFMSLKDKPVTFMDKAFRYAFLMHHPDVPMETIDEIRQRFGKSDKLVEYLLTMVTNTANDLFAGEDSKNTIEWEFK